MSRAISTLPFPPRWRNALEAANFSTDDEVLGTSAPRLAREAKLSLADAREIQAIIRAHATTLDPFSDAKTGEEADSVAAFTGFARGGTFATAKTMTALEVARRGGVASEALRARAEQQHEAALAQEQEQPLLHQLHSHGVDARHLSPQQPGGASDTGAAPTYGPVPPSSPAPSLPPLPSHAGPVSTMSRAVDALLNGGLSRGLLTEVSGVPGVGKTQLAMTAACVATLPGWLPGAGGCEALYIDAEGGIVPARLREIARGLVRRVQESAEIEAEEAEAEAEAEAADTATAAAATAADGASALVRVPGPWARAAALVSEEYILRRVHVMRPLDRAELVAAVKGLSAVLSARRGIRLVVVDSIASHFRYALGPLAGSLAAPDSATAAAAAAAASGHADSMRARAEAVAGLAKDLMWCATRMGAAVLSVNQIAYKDAAQVAERADLDCVGAPGGTAAAAATAVAAMDGGGRRIRAPVFSDAWAQLCSYRLMLHWRAGRRVARLFKGQDGAAAEVEFAVTEDGLADVPDTDLHADAEI